MNPSYLLRPFARQFPLLLGAVAILASMAPAVVAAPPVRGRDPWVFRIILENKPREVVVALRTDLWMVYNPANCAVFRVWSGGINYAGKVYDFSQNNSKTQGTTYYQGRDTIYSLLNMNSIPAGWTLNPANAVTAANGWWTFNGSASGVNTTLTSPIFDDTQYDNPIFLYYENEGNHITVDWSADGGTTWTAQSYISTQPGITPQENQKLIKAVGTNVRMRFHLQYTATSSPYNKTVNNITFFGDYKAWSAKQSGSTIPITMDWRGFATKSLTPGENPPNVDSVILKYDVVLPGGARVSIWEQPEQVAGLAVTRQFTVSGLPANTVLSLQLNGVGAYHEARTVSGAGSLRTVGADTFLDLTANGVATLNSTWTP